MKFDFLKPEQSRKLFRAYFNVDAPESIDLNTILAPGDFSNVQNKVNILGITDADEIYAMMCEETDLKPQKPKATIGFAKRAA
jgi:hypothetical protein